MKKWFLIPWLFLLICCGGERFKTAVNGQKDFETRITEKQSKLIFSESKNFPNNTELSIAIIENRKVNFYGVRRENDTIFTVENETRVFEIGSISKVFTSTLLADFVLNKKLGLDDPILDFVTWPIRDNIKITFKELANHTSGLPRLPTNFDLASMDSLNPYKNFDEGCLRDYFIHHLKLNQKPGEQFEYSNLGVGLLGYLLSSIDSTSYENLLQTKICRPYQMDYTTTNRDAVEDLLVKGLNAEGNETPNWDLNVLVGAGGILSCTSDLSKFALAQFDESNEVLALTRKSTYSIVDYKWSVGLGWAIKNTTGSQAFTHSGGTGGYRSVILIDITNENGVVILSNVSPESKNSVNIDNLGTRLMETIKQE